MIFKAQLYNIILFRIEQIEGLYQTVNEGSIQLLHYITVITVQIYSKSFQMLVCSVC